MVNMMIAKASRAVKHMMVDEWICKTLKLRVELRLVESKYCLQLVE